MEKVFDPRGEVRGASACYRTCGHAGSHSRFPAKNKGARPAKNHARNGPTYRPGTNLFEYVIAEHANC